MREAQRTTPILDLLIIEKKEGAVLDNNDGGYQIIIQRPLA